MLRLLSSLCPSGLSLRPIITALCKMTFLPLIAPGCKKSIFSNISANFMPLSAGAITFGIFVQYNLTLFCADTSLELISIGSTPNSRVIMSCHCFFILTFSNRKNLGLTVLNALTYSQNRYDCPSNSHPSSFNFK